MSIVDVHDLLNRPPLCLNNNDVFAFKTIKETWCVYYVRRELCKKKLTLSYLTGFAVGQLLTMWKAPEAYYECAVGIIIKDWAFRLKKHEQWHTDEGFCKGIQEGLQYGPPELRQDLPKQAQPVVKGGKRPGSSKGNLVERTTPTELSTVSQDTTSVTSHIAPQKQATSPAGSKLIRSGKLLDAIITDRDQTQRSKAQEDEVFAGLPAIYEAEIKEFEDRVQPQNTKWQAYEAPSGLTITYEIEILMEIKADFERMIVKGSA